MSELREEFTVVGAAGYPDPIRVVPNTEEKAREFADKHRRPPLFPAIVKRRLVTEWEDLS